MVQGKVAGKAAREVVGRRTVAGLVVGLLVLVTSMVATQSAASANQVVTVQPGESLWSIAAQFHVSAADIEALNHLGGNPNFVEAGAKLLVPTSTSSPGGRVHVVEPGETLIGIAREFGVTPAAIAAINTLGPGGTVYAGTTIAIPAQAEVSASSAAQTAALPAAGAYPSTTLAAAAQSRQELAESAVPSTSEVRALVAQTAQSLGVDEDLALAVADQESGFQQRVVSNADAIGAMQVLPATAAQLSSLAGHQLNPLNASDNVLAGVLELRLLTRAASLDQAIAGYYQGLSSVRSKGMYPDTQQYVRDVLALRQGFATGRL